MKSCRLYILILTVMAFSLSQVTLYAQRKSIGCSFSYTGISLDYEHYLQNEDTFLNIQLRAETEEMNMSRSSYPGISASATWNFVIRQWSTPENNAIKLFAGPGVVVGYTQDFKTRDGLLFGLKVRIGAECCFNRNVTLSACIAPVLGVNATVDDDSVIVKYYRNGLQFALIPEIGIKYRF